MKIYINFCLAVLMAFFVGTLAAQESLPEYKQLMLDPSGVQLSEIQQKAEAFFADKDKGRGSGYKQWKRWEYLAERRLMPNGAVANFTAQNWKTYQENIDYLQQNNSNKSGGDLSEATNGYWTFYGPTNHTLGAGWNGGVGRVNCIAFHPTNSSIIYIGVPAGGLWKSTNGGTNWECLTDGMPSIGVSGIVVSHSNPNIIYILTGDGDGGDTQSIGVMKTTDGGGYWYQTGLAWDISNFERGYKLMQHPTNSNILFAATTDGIYKTTNAGASWYQVTSGATHQDMEFKPGDPTIMYASRGTQFWRSTDTGENWTQITSGVPTNASRMALGVTPDQAAYVYIFAGPTTGVGSFVGVYRSFDSGLSFGAKANTPNLLGYDQNGNDNDHQTTYDLAIAINGVDVADVMTGGINVWTSTNFGNPGTFTISSHWYEAGNTIGYTHADIHALEVNPLNNYVYCGSDGGIYRSTNFGATWTDLTQDLGITQWFRIDGTEANSSLFIGGTQDNGSNKFSGGTSMIHMRGADGMDAMIDHSNSNILYTTRQYGTLEKSTNGGASFSGIKPSGVSGTWVTPLIMNPSNSSIIYGGYSDVMKSTNGGSTWSNMGVNGSEAMAMGTNNTSRIYAADGSTLYMSNNAGSTWATVSGGLPFQTITFLAVNPDYSLDVFVTFGGYTSGSKVYRSTNAGTSWTNISGSLPNVPVNCIAYQDTDGAPNDALYVGTDIGIFYRDDDLGDWIPFGNGLPVVPVFDLDIHYGSSQITAATFGRGLWRSSLFVGCPSGYSLTVANDPSNPNYTGFQYYEASSTVTSTRVITGGLGTDVTYKAGGSVTLGQGFHAKSGNKFKAILGPCEALKSPEIGVPLGNEGMIDEPDGE